MQNQAPQQPQKESSQSGSGKPYAKPLLVEYGQVRDLVGGGAITEIFGEDALYNNSPTG